MAHSWYGKWFGKWFGRWFGQQGGITVAVSMTMTLGWMAPGIMLHWRDFGPSVTVPGGARDPYITAS